MATSSEESDWQGFSEPGNGPDSEPDSKSSSESGSNTYSPRQPSPPSQLIRRAGVTPDHRASSDNAANGEQDGEQDRNSESSEEEYDLDYLYEHT